MRLYRERIRSRRKGPVLHDRLVLEIWGRRFILKRWGPDKAACDWCGYVVTSPCQNAHHRKNCEFS